MATKQGALCTNNGCSSRFTADTNGPEACVYHSGAPVFHEGLKGWSCCKTRETSFDDFLNIPGCTRGPHSDVAKPKPAAPAPQPVDVRFKAMDGGKEVYATSSANIGKSDAAKAPAPAPAPVAEQPDAPDAVIAQGTECLHNGCKVKFAGDAQRSEPCLYHPGAAVFHEGSKYWSCCKRGHLDFEEMITQPGCETGRHKFVRDGPAKGALAKCRVQAYQTPSEVCVCVFAKGVRQDRSRIAVRDRELELELELGDDTRFVRTWTLPHRISPVDSTHVFMATKVEFVLRKGDGDQWALEVFK